MKNKYAKSSHISERKFQQLVRLFAAGLEASQIARLTNLNRNTINRYLKKIRQRLVEYCDTQSPFSGEAEVDESFFGARLSLQRHQHRAEHWAVVRGVAEITCENVVQTLEANQSFYIPIGDKHRLANPGDQVLEIIEVQTGAVLSEDDIERFDDDHGR